MQGQEITIKIRKDSMTPNHHYGEVLLDGRVVANGIASGTVAVLETLKEKIINRNIAISPEWGERYTGRD
jgi:hypothetical protein